VAAVPSGLSLTQTQEIKKEKKLSAFLWPGPSSTFLNVCGRFFVGIWMLLKTTPWRRMQKLRYRSTLIDLFSRRKWLVAKITSPAALLSVNEPCIPIA
jgi:hypothetical protein